MAKTKTNEEILQEFKTKDKTFRKGLKRLTDFEQHYHDYMTRNFYDPYDSLTEEERDFWRHKFERLINWDKINDLKYRHEMAIRQNNREYVLWHFDTYGWVAFS